LLEQVRSDTDRFSHTTTSSAKYQYDGDRIVSIDTESGFWASKPAGIDLGEGIISRVDASNYYAGTPSAGHTVYRYDTSGNNFERVTTDPSGNVTARYLAVYDTAKNLICEQNTRAGLPDSVIHYDYSCF